MSAILSLDDDREGALEQATKTLESGSVIVLPVGGVYAVVADAFRPAATQRIFAARRRSRVTPLPVLVRSERQVGGLAGDVPDWADRLMASYWPGDMTLILPASQDVGWDLGNTKGTVQVRLPEDELVRDLINRVGPLACTSANRLGQDRPTTVEAAKAQLGVLIPFYLDGGELDGRVSTIVDATGPSVVVHREGSIPESHIRLVAAGEIEWGERPDPELHPPIPAEDDPEGQVEPETSEDEVVGEVPATPDLAAQAGENPQVEGEGSGVAEPERVSAAPTPDPDQPTDAVDVADALAGGPDDDSDVDTHVDSDVDKDVDKGVGEGADGDDARPAAGGE